MTAEQTAAVAVAANPYDPETFSHGGGLWDGKTVTFTRVEAKIEALTYGDSKPVVDKETGQQVVQVGLVIAGIADGGDDKERRETYTCGERIVPTPDGRGFKMKDGSPLKFHANSNMGKLSAALKAAGFDLSTLIERGPSGEVVQRLDKLTGARFVMKGELKRGQDGKTIKDKKGYDKNTFLPVKFVGYATGATVAAAPAHVSGGNGAATADAITAKAEGAVLKALAEAGGKLTRAELVRKLAQGLVGDADSNAIIGLVVKDDWHKGRAWKYDGTAASL